MSTVKKQPVKQEPESNYPQIHYKALPGKRVIITGISGFLTEREFMAKFGQDVFAAYADSEPNMFFNIPRNNNMAEYLELRSINKGKFYLRVGETLSGQEFSEIRNLAKACGQRLFDIKKALKAPSKTIYL